MEHIGMEVNDRVGAHRERMRQLGFRLVQMWVPDVRADTFAVEARRQSLAVSAADRITGGQEFIDAASAPWDE